MGKLLYGDSGLVIDFDDRALAHLQVVIGAKLRRHEAFYFSWRNETSVGSGRCTLWLDHSIPLYFKYASSDRPSINRAWIDELAVSANQPQGLFLSAEPGK